jgi:hypothetical protein
MNYNQKSEQPSAPLIVHGYVVEENVPLVNIDAAPVQAAPVPPQENVGVCRACGREFVR